MLVCAGLKGLPDAVGEVWPKSVVQTCVVHLVRASFRCAGRQDCDKIAKQITRAVGPVLGGGHVADYIPALAGVDLTRFGFAVADLTARVHGTETGASPSPSSPSPSSSLSPWS